MCLLSPSYLPPRSGLGCYSGEKAGRPAVAPKHEVGGEGEGEEKQAPRKRASFNKQALPAPVLCKAVVRAQLLPPGSPALPLWKHHRTNYLQFTELLGQRLRESGMAMITRAPSALTQF